MTEETTQKVYEHKFGTIKTSADLKVIPGYLSKVDFSEASKRRLDEMLDGYDFTKEDEYPCGIKGCATKHQHGYLVRTTDGILTNIGNRCGKKYLDLDFDRVKKDYTTRRKAADNLESLNNIRNNFSPYQSRLDSIVACCIIFARCRKCAFECLPDQLGTAMHMGRIGVREITRTRRMSKREASIHYAQTNTSSKDYEGRRPSIDEVIGRLSGLSIFKEDVQDFVRNEIIKPLDEMKAISDFSLEFLSDKKLEDLSRKTNIAIRQIAKAEDLIDQGFKFYSAENISLFELMGADKNSVAQTAMKITNITMTPIKQSD